MLNRRQFIGNTAFIAIIGGLSIPAAQAGSGPGSWADAIRQDIAAIEKARGGRLGVSVLDLATGQQAAWRGDERFAMYSTFKFLLAGFILSRVDAGQERLDRTLPVTKADLISWSPLTEGRVGGEMSIAELCEATIIQSDNTAANLLLASSGGPAALTAFIRGLGDAVTRCDRTEPTANDVPPGELRDTTSPNAMLGLMRVLLLGSVLSPAARKQLTGWLIDNRTGRTRLRAGLPAGWRIGDKTGSNRQGGNDIAILWPPAGGSPILVTSYYWNPAADDASRSAGLAEVAAVVARHLGAAPRSPRPSPSL